jgi:hypothetical protein
MPVARAPGLWMMKRKHSSEKWPLNTSSALPKSKAKSKTASVGGLLRVIIRDPSGQCPGGLSLVKLLLVTIISAQNRLPTRFS